MKKLLLTFFTLFLIAFSYHFYSLQDVSIKADMRMTFTMLFIVVFLAFIYFIPSFVASYNKHRQIGAIVALNIFLGWTFIGWVASLVWSLTKKA